MTKRRTFIALSALIASLRPLTKALTYTVEVVDGEIPSSGNDVSVFIDIIGMPLTPVSYAGVARRTYARAVIY